MTHLDPAAQSALEADWPLHGYAIEVDYPTFTLRLLDGAGFLVIGGQTFVGLDETYGALVLPESFEDGVQASAPNIGFGINVPTNTAAAALCDPTAQGGAISVWYWCANRATGALIGSPYQIWYGALDAPTLTVGKRSRMVKIDAESYFGRFNDSADGNLLTNACHQAIWPGELGLQYVTDVQQIMPWGADSPRPVMIKDVLQGQTPSLGVGAGQIGAVRGSAGRYPGQLDLSQLYNL